MCYAQQIKMILVKLERQAVTQTLDVIFFTFRNINSIDVKIAKNALRLMDTASAAHPYALSNSVWSLPNKGKHNIYLFFCGVRYCKQIKLQSIIFSNIYQ